MSGLNSALYSGRVAHCRYQPRIHRFDYAIFLLALDLDELEHVNQGWWFKVGKPALLSFKASDYLDKHSTLTRQHVWHKVTTLGGTDHEGRVVFLGQVRCLGFYFSPVNFYYCHDQQGQLRYLLAEVSNTPWNERHYYLVDAIKQAPCEKAFHVSPFMDLAMHYHWRFSELQNKLYLHIENHRTEDSSKTQSKPLFNASLALTRQPLTKANLAKQLARIPVMTLKTVLAIYWQALKLLLKKIPYIPKTTKPQEMP